jgi:hypothetical protein
MELGVGKGGSTSLSGQMGVKGAHPQKSRARTPQIGFGLIAPGCKAKKLLNLSIGGKEIRKQRKVSWEVTNTLYSFYSM